eukprot:1474206-Alexandrium_andersonii.AAC.1
MLESVRAIQKMCCLVASLASTPALGPRAHAARRKQQAFIRDDVGDAVGHDGAEDEADDSYRNALATVV